MIISNPNQIVDLQQNSFLSQNKLFLLYKRISIVYVSQTYHSNDLILFFKNFKFVPVIMKTRYYSCIFNMGNKTSFLISTFKFKVLSYKNNTY